MPNPNFTGNVPHRRCETCKSWDRPEHLNLAKGLCRANTHFETRPADSRMAGSPSVAHAVEFWTTDLSVCSNWDGKTE